MDEKLALFSLKKFSLQFMNKNIQNSFEKKELEGNKTRFRLTLIWTGVLLFLHSLFLFGYCENVRSGIISLAALVIFMLLLFLTNFRLSSDHLYIFILTHYILVCALLIMHFALGSSLLEYESHILLTVGLTEGILLTSFSKFPFLTFFLPWTVLFVMQLIKYDTLAEKFYGEKGCEPILKKWKNQKWQRFLGESPFSFSS